MSKKRALQVSILLLAGATLINGGYNRTSIQFGDLQGGEKIDHPSSATVDQYIQEQMLERRIPGLALAVVQNGTVIYAKGYGLADVARGIPVTTDSVFLLASLTKQFTATAIMMLLEENRLSLDDPIERFLPSPPDKWKDITIRHLLTHTAGLSSCPFAAGRVSTATQYAWAEECQMDFAAGDEWRYSNEGYVLLGMIIERASGKKYADFLSERIFQPLGMESASVLDWNQPPEGVVQEYTLHSGRLEPIDRYLPIELPSSFGVFSTALDLARWDRALYAERLLTRSSLDQMWTPGRLNSGVPFPYGFGWAIDDQNGHRYVSHAGDTGTEITRYIDDKLTVIVLTNLGSPTPESSEVKSWGLTRKVARLYLPGLAYSPIKDTDPNITAAITFFVRNMDNPAMWDDGFEQLYSPALWRVLKAKEPQLVADAKSFGELVAIDLVEKRSADGSERFRYRATYKSATVVWTVSLDRDLKIIDILGEDE